jgi:hypothetical protein
VYLVDFEHQCHGLTWSPEEWPPQKAKHLHVLIDHAEFGWWGKPAALLGSVSLGVTILHESWHYLHFFQLECSEIQRRVDEPIYRTAHEQLDNEPVSRCCKVLGKTYRVTDRLQEIVICECFIPVSTKEVGRAQ